MSRVSDRFPLDVIAGIAIVAVIIGVGVRVQSTRYRSTPHIGENVQPQGSDTTLPFELRDETARSRLVHTHAKFVPAQSLANVAPWIAGLAGASVAVVDYDRDGWQDVYFTNGAIGSRNALFHNNHDGTFTDVAAKAGLADVNGSAGSLRALFFDMDNDGYDDLVLTTTYCPRIFHNRGDGTFEEVTSRAGVSYCGYVTASNVLDFDGDGYLDLVIAGYYRNIDFMHPNTTKFMPSTPVFADNGGPILVYRNRHDGTFEQVPDNLGLKSRGWTHAIGVYDFRNTGHEDLYFATDFNADQIYWNDGYGHFIDKSGTFGGPKYSRMGMSAEVADFNNDGHAAVYVTDTYEPKELPDKNAFWRMTDDNRLENVAGNLGAATCGWSWGAKFVDLDNDTHLDLVVTNGFISARKDLRYWFKKDLITSSSMMEDAALWPSMVGATLAGYETKCVYYNRGGKLEDVSGQTDMGHDDSDGRGVAAIDVMNDGLISLVEANVGQPARFYRNIAHHTNHWIGFDLTGTRSNRNAFGTRIVITLADGTRLTRELQPANGYESESDHRVHFGLGADPEIKSIHIRWPQGTVQDVSSLELDRYHALREP